MEVRPRAVLAGSIARRAVDLALDGGVSFGEASSHLCRLSGGLPGPLEDALHELPGPDAATPEQECARLLLVGTIAGLPSPGTR